MNEEILKHIKQGILNYYADTHTKHLTDLSGVLTYVNSLLVIDDTYRFEFKLNERKLYCNVVKIENNESCCLESVEFVILQPSTRFYPLITINGDTSFVISELEQFKVYIVQLLETPKFGKLFCKWFPDLETKLCKKA